MNTDRDDGHKAEQLNTQARDYTVTPEFERPMIEPDVMRYSPPHYIRRWNDVRAFYGAALIAVGLALSGPAMAKEAPAVSAQELRHMGGPCVGVSTDEVMRSATERRFRINGHPGTPIAISELGVPPLTDLCRVSMLLTFDGGSTAYEYRFLVSVDDDAKLQIEPLTDFVRGNPPPIRIFH